MELFLKWLALASVQTAATISPGPAFVMAVRSAVTGGRRAALMTSLGLGVGVGLHVLNPKAVIFFTAVYTQFIDPHTPYQILFLYGATSVLIETLWFSGVVIVLTNERIRQKFMAVVHWIDRCCGGLMVLLGLKLALSK